MTEWKEFKNEKPSKNITALVEDSLMRGRYALAMYHVACDRWYLLEDTTTFAVYVTHYLEIKEREKND